MPPSGTTGICALHEAAHVAGRRQRGVAGPEQQRRVDRDDLEPSVRAVLERELLLVDLRRGSTASRATISVGVRRALVEDLRLLRHADRARRRRQDHAAHAGRRRRLEHAARAVDVQAHHALRVVGIARDEAGEVEHAPTRRRRRAPTARVPSRSRATSPRRARRRAPRAPPTARAPSPRTLWPASTSRRDTGARRESRSRR